LTDPRRIDEVEEDLRQRAAEDLPALEAASKAGDRLALIIGGTPVPPVAGDQSARELQHHAIWLMAIQAFRALRVAMNTIAIGYEDQAVGKARLIFEVHARAEKVLKDQTGEYAREWLEGRRGGSGARLVGQQFWETLSGPPHATVRGTLDWTAISNEDGSTEVVLGPERRSQLSNSTLTSLAANIRDIGHMLELVTGVSAGGLEELDAEIDALGEIYLPEDGDSSEEPGATEPPGTDFAP
jgi:hypothetical protein